MQAFNIRQNLFDLYSVLTLTKLKYIMSEHSEHGARNRMQKFEPNIKL